MRGAVLIGGTTSDAGKSMVVAGLCRLLAREGVRVAPFKAQNMSNNSVATLDGGEIGRAQAAQAAAAGLEPSVRFNPVLLKPGSDRRSHVVLRGRDVGEVGAADYASWRSRLRGAVLDDLAALRVDFDVVIVEGAGSVAEINLRDSDIANLGLASAARLPVVLVSDIDRGGSLAHLFGTTAILPPDDQRLVRGFVVNKFRGDPALLAPGLESLTALTGRPTLGVVPFEPRLWLDAEDSLSAPVGARLGPPPGRERAEEPLRVAAIRLPRVSNTTDVEALAAEPGVEATWVADAASVRAADLVVVPGTRATVDDLQWLRSNGIGEALIERVAAGAPVFAVCGGFQMLSSRIVDDVESCRGTVAGLGIVGQTVRFAPDKTVRRAAGTVWGHDAHGYEIHHGVVEGATEPTWLTVGDGAGEGVERGALWGTHWHGLLENDEVRRALLTRVAAARGTRFRPGSASFAAVRAQQFDVVADLLAAHLDRDALHTIVEGPSGEPPVIRHKLG
ncbi:cobyric acid synthase [Gordonia araii NBRC 100433]|uniref:Cobyric acid synthase n=1 Tax=Gordonia araii NBRC 100433 TaxID=1073574 RepID=G7H4Z8_9ACTN|nr:cobyric acid synthase [Gordonia araii]NNG96613.1 cobyric acid synthase [Gordonia araii NBRC 100433]GAB10923.1 cobyric acid synthase [Gordonia araii NBRC 100433]